MGEVVEARGKMPLLEVQVILGIFHVYFKVFEEVIDKGFDLDHLYQ